MRYNPSKSDPLGNYFANVFRNLAISARQNCFNSSNTGGFSSMNCLFRGLPRRLHQIPISALARPP